MLSMTQNTGAYVTYDNVLEFFLEDDGLELFVTVSATSSVSGSDCFTNGPIPFTTLGPLKIHIPYLLRQCVAEFMFQFLVGLISPWF